MVMALEAKRPSAPAAPISGVWVVAEAGVMRTKRRVRRRDKTRFARFRCCILVLCLLWLWVLDGFGGFWNEGEKAGWETEGRFYRAPSPESIT